jgi:hypothetical protein
MRGKFAKLFKLIRNHLSINFSKTGFHGRPLRFLALSSDRESVISIGVEPKNYKFRGVGKPVDTHLDQLMDQASIKNTGCTTNM